MNRKTTVLLCVTVLLVVTAATVVYLYQPYVYPGVTVAGVDMGGRTRDEVRQIVSQWREDYRRRRLHMYYQDTVVFLKAAAFDYDLDVDGVADAAWWYGRRGPWWRRLAQVWTARRQGQDIPLCFKYDEGKLADALATVAARVEVPARNATLSVASGGIVPQQVGRRLDVARLRQEILAALPERDIDSIALPVTSVYPAITVSDIQASGISELVAAYTTTFDPADVNRTANIVLGAQKLNGTIIWPGETVSFNTLVGPRDKAHGFKEALEIVDGEFVPGIGGGICQVSSTLYNVALLANLRIVERYNHAKLLHYVPLGRDATVVYGALDFKFANDTVWPLLIMAEVDGPKLCIALFGPQKLDETVEIVTAHQRLIPPKVIKRLDERLYLGETKLEHPGQPGYEVTTVRVVRRGGREVKREVLSKDTYQADDTVVLVGTRVLPPDAPGQDNK